MRRIQSYTASRVSMISRWHGDLPDRSFQYAGADQHPKRCGQKADPKMASHSSTSMEGGSMADSSQTRNVISPTEHDEEGGQVAIAAARKGRAMNAVKVGKEIENALARMRLVGLKDTRTAEPSGIRVRVSCAKDLETHPCSQHKATYISRLSGRTCCRSRIKIDSRC